MGHRARPAHGAGLLGALLLFPCGALAQDVDALRQQYQQAKTEEARLAAVQALRERGGERAAGVLGEVLGGDPAEQVRLAAVEGLLALRSPEAARSLLDAINEWDPFVTEAVVRGLSESAPEEVVAWILDEGLEAAERPDVEAALVAILGAQPADGVYRAVKKRAKHKNWRVRSAAAGALALLDAKQALGELKRLAKDKREQVRVAAFRALAEVPGRKAVRLLVDGAQKDTSWQARQEAVRSLVHRGAPAQRDLLLDLADNERRDWRVRSVCVQGLGEVRELEVVDALLELLDDTDGRLRVDVRRALQRLTGERFADLAGWNDWWAARREGYVFPAAGAEAEATPIDDAMKTRTRFYGLPVESLRPCFVIDCSGSMNEPAGPGAGELASRARNNAPAPVGPSKLEVAKQELERALGSLPPEAVFGVILFRERTIPVQETAVPAKPKYIKRVLALVDEVAAGGATDIYGPLATVLHGSRPNEVKPAEHVEFDTVFLLSDGLPTVGLTTDPTEIRRRISDFNRAALVRIHTIGIGDQNRELLEGLAQDTGGRYVKR